MRNNVFNVVFFLAIATGFTFLYLYADKHWIPKPEKKEPPPEPAPVVAEYEMKVALASVAGVAAITAEEGRRLAAEEAQWQIAERTREEKKSALLSVTGAAVTASPMRRIPAAPVTLIQLGDDTFYNQVLLSTRGGGVQQVVLPKFESADRLGKPIKGTPFYLVPGIPMPRGKFLTEPYPIPDLKPGMVADSTHLAEPAFTIFHYLTPDDKFPVPLLGEMPWTVVAEERPAGGTHKVVFEAQLDDPFFVKFRKTYTLAPKDYHVGLKLEVERLPGGQKGQAPLRIQLSGPRGLPLEGEWYATTTRAALVGWLDKKQTPRRQHEDASSVAVRRGGEAVVKGDNTFKYMVVATQFFASGVAIDNTMEGPALNPWAYVRATTELPFDKKADPNTSTFDDLTVRAAFDPLDLAPREKSEFSFLIYNGPSKVALLGMMEGNRAVDEALVARYRDGLGLRTITDFRSDTWIGRFANAIYWSDLVIAFTNIMHWLLGSIHVVVSSWALCIVVLTVMVRLLLFVPSKKQTQMNLRMMEVQKKLAPQLEELKKKYVDDPQAFNREKMKLMMANGANPFAMMGGCLLLIAQMPVMMGLYFCLQESVFFRLEPFLWIQNLAAPDMLIWWGERIPFISTPEDLGSFIYLGPFFNVLPILAVALMIWQQNKMMPPPTDEQMAQQQKMMKYMMIMVAVMFYKVAAGLALYFIIGSIWAIVERRFIPKADDKKKKDDGDDAGELAGLNPKAGSPNGHVTTTTQTSKGPVELPKPKGFFGRLKAAMKEKMEEMQKHADEMSKRQIRNKGGQSPNDNDDPNRRDDKRDKKKKRRK